MQRMPARVPSLIVAGLVLLLPACQTLDKAAAELTPYGVQLNERIAQWERACKDMKLGPYYDNNPANRNDASCDFLFLKDKHWDPEADQFSRYAHSINVASASRQTAGDLPGGNEQRRIPQGTLREGSRRVDLSHSVECRGGVCRRGQRVPNPPGIQSSDAFRAGAPCVRQRGRQSCGWPWEQQSIQLHVLRIPRRRGRRIAPNPSLLPGSREVFANMEPGREVHWRQSRNRFRVPYVVDKRSRAPYAFVGRGTVRPEFAITESRIRTPRRRHQYEGSSWRSGELRFDTDLHRFPWVACTRTRLATSAALSRPTPRTEVRCTRAQPPVKD